MDYSLLGLFHCIIFSQHSSSAKFDSGTGWPSFHTAIETTSGVGQSSSQLSVIEKPDNSYGMVRVEVLCRQVRFVLFITNEMLESYHKYKPMKKILIPEKYRPPVHTSQTVNVISFIHPSQDSSINSHFVSFHFTSCCVNTSEELNPGTRCTITLSLNHVVFYTFI